MMVAEGVEHLPPRDYESRVLSRYTIYPVRRVGVDLIGWWARRIEIVVLRQPRIRR